MMARELEDELREDVSEPTSEQVGLAVLERLRVVDEVAYLRFASVYKGFEGVDDFRREVGLLTKTTAPKRPEAEVAELVTEPPERALAIYAASGRSGRVMRRTMAAWSKAGCEVRILLCTDGGKGSVGPGTDVGRTAVRRAAESAEAGELLGIAGQECLNYPDGELDDDAGLREALVAAVRRFRPGIVLCPDPTAVFFGQDYFNHRDHRITGMAALDAVAPAAALPTISRAPAQPTR